jgi:hypothetical protein
MFPATIGAYNANTRPPVVHLPRSWARDEPPEEPQKTPEAPAPGPNVRRAAKATTGQKRVDPTAELAREILGTDPV